MKGFDVDWAAVIEGLRLWERLSPPSRRRVLTLEPSVAVEAQRIGPALDELLAAGVLERPKASPRVRPTQAFRPTLKVLRAMDRAPIFTAASEARDARVVGEYLAEILTGDERASLSGERAWMGARHLPAMVRDRDHLEGFLACDDPADWEDARRPSYFRRTKNAAALLASEAAAKDTRALLRALMARTDPVPLLDLKEHVPRLSRRRLGDSILAALRYALAFAGFDAEGRPALGLCPAVSRRLHRPVAPPPEPVEPEEASAHTWGLDDVIQLLVFCSEPRRLRGQDHALFARAQRELEALLAPVPESLLDPERVGLRIQEARNAAEALGFVAIAGEHGRTLRLELTQEGRAWLAAAPDVRARELLESARLAPEEAEAEEPWYDPFTSDASDLRAAFGSLAGPVRLDAFLRYQAESANPLKSGDRGRESPWSSQVLSEEELETLWARQLLDLLESALVPLGGVRVGVLEGRRTIEVTAVGRYLLGLTDELEWASAETEAGALVVQPDFEVVFLAPNPGLEGSITRFAERIGQGVGALFRLTPASIQSAVAAGLTREEILATLEQASTEALPANVRREIEEWSARCVQLDWQPAQLLRCPDEETAARLLAASRGKLELVGPTVLALTNPRQRSAVANACRKAGIFLGLPEEPETRRRAPSRRRRRSRWH